jgi:hypothetical protein
MDTLLEPLPKSLATLSCGGCACYCSCVPAQICRCTIAPTTGVSVQLGHDEPEDNDVGLAALDRAYEGICYCLCACHCDPASGLAMPGNAFSDGTGENGQEFPP